MAADTTPPATAPTTAPTPTEEAREELLLSCRYGDLDDVQAFVASFGPSALGEIRDENGNTVLHMVAGNGHLELLDYLLPLVPPSLLSTPNASLSTPLHWATLNTHLDIAKHLVQHPAGPGASLIDIKNAAGRSPLGEAALAEWDEGTRWFLEVMNIDDGAVAQSEVQNADAEVEAETSGTGEAFGTHETSKDVGTLGEGVANLNVQG
ncbi:hypothetical protein BOTBODRAFT_56404 [Botryobasidium botryosum FD-172 SS1]|uniref:Uncharacterized protein n=1 Tax=Botryobasidium botryosum (strain FD-172 SS1) TaxID=930990 RepID=A0A067MDU6_BOTB1|nr:hypothetical protein BOTBODRAFT_56404 [Botryobasidium botryosum FD-172 SS1]